MPNLPTMHDVESHMIAKMGYDAANQSLFVQFHGSAKSGPALWRYDGVTPMEYAHWAAALPVSASGSSPTSGVPRPPLGLADENHLQVFHQAG